MALANHPLIGQADAEARAAAARRGQVASVKLPQVDATAGASWAEAHSTASGEQVRSTASNVQGTVTQLVTDFGRTGAVAGPGRGPGRSRGAGARAGPAWKSCSTRGWPISTSCAP